MSEPSAATLTELTEDDLNGMLEYADKFVVFGSTPTAAAEIHELVAALRAARHAQQQNEALMAAAEQLAVDAQQLIAYTGADEDAFGTEWYGLMDKLEASAGAVTVALEVAGET